jgi:hypothetical protein
VRESKGHKPQVEISKHLNDIHLNAMEVFILQDLCSSPWGFFLLDQSNYFNIVISPFSVKALFQLCRSLH